MTGQGVKEGDFESARVLGGELVAFTVAGGFARDASGGGPGNAYGFPDAGGSS